MKIKLLVPFLLLSFFAAAQKPEDILNKWAEQSPIEKIYLHLDRDHYVAGETAWFKAYLASDWQPDTISTTVYVELVNEKASLITRKVLPVLLGGANGQIELPDTLSTGNYLIRAYTATMMNQDPGFIYKRNVFVFGKNKKAVNDVVPVSNIIVDLFPEGGNLVAGFNNTVAFKATGENGMPVEIKGSVKNSKGEEAATINTLHDGMGMFELIPVIGEKYNVVLSEPLTQVKYALPDPVLKGIVFSLIPHPQGNFFEIHQKTDDPAFTASYMVGQMQHHVVFRQTFANIKPEMQGVINTEHLNSGILQVTIFNKDGMPLAERLSFVNNKEYTEPVTLLTDTLDLSARGRNRFSVAMTDTIKGSLSISIVDADYESTAMREDNIISALLLTSDLKGYIHNPAWYFSGDDDSIKTALDLVMMTNGWRRFKWTELTNHKTGTFKDNAFITLTGRINLRGSKKAFDDKDILLMISGVNKKRSTHLLHTDKDGNFRLDSLMFFDKNRLLFSDVRGKKSQYIDVIMNGDSLYRGFSLPAMAALPYHSAAVQSKWQMDYDAIVKANGLMLEGITIKSVRKSPLQQLDDTYTSGAFSGDAEKAIDLVNTDEAGAYRNIFDYLQSRVNGLDITADGFDYTIYYRQPTAAVSSMGKVPMTLYLDEIETDASVIASLPANQVALVKVYTSFVGAAGNGPGGVMAIYTKKGTDYTGTGFINYSVYNGYSVAKEFYAPDYKVDKADAKTDNRITIDWRPNIFINSINPRIPFSFYNNDRTRKFKVVVEGMTTSGKLIWLEKTIMPAQKAF